MRVKNIMRYLVAINEVPTHEIAIQELESLLAAFGFQFYCVFHQPKPIENAAELIIAANWPPEWVDRYVEKKYIITDPTIRYMLRSNRPFSWNQAVEAYRETAHYRRMKKMMQDGKSHGMVSGYIFPVFGRNGLIGATTVGGNTEIELSPAEIMLLDTALRSTFFTLIRFAGLEKAPYIADGIDITMTHREIESLGNLAEGRTSAEIAALLKVSSNTVDWYVNSLQEKLGVRNRPHAVAEGFRRGLIT